MSTPTVKKQCFACKKASRTFNCEGCSQNFCADCLTKHLQELKKNLATIESEHEQFRQKVNEQKKEPKKRSLIQQIDDWEEASIGTIKQTAQQCRQRLINYTSKFINNIENKLNDLTKQIKQIAQENQFNEIDLDELKDRLKLLREQLDKPPHVEIQQQPTAFVSKIATILPIDRDTKWKSNGLTVAGGHGQGDQLNQLSIPQCMIIDEDHTIYIADSANHRIISWKPNDTFGRIVAGGFGKGNQTTQLDSPGDLVLDKETNSYFISDIENKRIMKWSTINNNNGQLFLKDVDCNGITTDRTGAIYISDSKKNEVRRWRKGEKTGTLVAGGHGQGSAFNQLNYPTCIFVDDQFSLYISDCLNHRVIKYTQDAKEGIVVAGGNEAGDQLNQLYCPQGIIVDQLGGIYIVDWGNHRVVRWYEEDSQGTLVVGGNQAGPQTDQFNCPVGLAFDPQGNLYVTDSENHRVQKFEVN